MTEKGKPTLEQDPLAFLAGGGEMGERTRGLTWSTTPLGPVAGWPHLTVSAICADVSLLARSDNALPP